MFYANPSHPIALRVQERGAVKEKSLNKTKITKIWEIVKRSTNRSKISTISLYSEERWNILKNLYSLQLLR